MTKIPLSRIRASEEKQLSIRNAVKHAEQIPGLARLAVPEDTFAMTELLQDKRVSEPIYTLPKRIDQQAIEEFIKRHLAERARGEGLLMVSINDQQKVNAYHDIIVWPQWACAELGGAIHPDRQNAGNGLAGAIHAFNWLFEYIGVDLICETAALDNFRSIRLLNKMGFNYIGQIESELPEGGIRPSHYWELRKEDWRRIMAEMNPSTKVVST